MRNLREEPAGGTVVLLALFMLAGVVGVLKGLTPTLDPRKEFYWLFSYQCGFIKRGLIGTLVHPLLRIWPFDDLKPNDEDRPRDETAPGGAAVVLHGGRDLVPQ